MDVDWCLSCERKLHGLPSSSGPYCSPQCLSYAQPSSSIRPSPFPLSQSGAHRIRQWAQAIPPHIPAGAPALPFADLPSPEPSPLLSERPPSPRARLAPTPKLIERTAASTPLPTLCISSPAHVRPPHHTRAQSQTLPQPANTPACMSDASTSLTSLLSEPMVATPDEDASFGANIGAFVRSWVHRDRANSTKSTRDVYVIEKVTDYFPPMPLVNKTGPQPSSSKKSLKTAPSPAPRRKPSVRKLVSAPDPDRSSTSHSHTPTPVVFPSCRAAELDWVDADDEDEGQDDMVVAPQPQYFVAFDQKHEPQRQSEPVYWTRPPSPLSSVSSSNSSVLLMAPKRWDAVRGRKGVRAVVA